MNSWGFASPTMNGDHLIAGALQTRGACPWPGLPSLLPSLRLGAGHFCWPRWARRAAHQRSPWPPASRRAPLPHREGGSYPGSAWQPPSKRACGPGAGVTDSRTSQGPGCTDRAGWKQRGGSMTLFQCQEAGVAGLGVDWGMSLPLLKGDVLPQISCSPWECGPASSGLPVLKRS
ncbi:hypothetical protein HJG60_010060 [Phyllostomus discolor]|uniref:Uncharacterized protein n=1 Tax=Phyllostomus discolor TaxID=89673 RepID=A0A834AZ58_9CHIR|nr:hypothetical protein HJG60_010060 [Phyllostomus discolor]